MKIIVQNIFKALCTLIQYIICGWLQLLTNCITDDTFTPSLEVFLINDGSYGGLMTQETFTSITDAFRYISLSLALLLFALHIFFFFLGVATEQKDNIFELIFRAIVAFAGAFCILDLLDIFMTFGKEIFTEVLNPIMTEFKLSFDGLGNTFWSQSNPEEVFGALSDTTFTDLNSFFSGETVAFEIFKSLIQIVFFAIVAYNFTKLCLELIKRYITMCILYMGSPIATSFYASAESQNVFFSYVKFFAVEVGVLLFTKFWVAFSLHTMATINCTFINMFIMIAVIQFGVKIEMFLKEIGLTTSALGGSLFDSVVATGAAMGIMIKQSTGVAGDALVNAGGLTGSMGLTTIGSALSGKPMSFEGRAKTMADSVGSSLRSAMGQGSSTSNLTASQKKVMDQAINENGLFRNQALQGVLKNLNGAGYKEALNHIADSNFGSLKEKLSDSNAVLTPNSYAQNNGIGFEYKSGNGMKRQGFISDTPKTGHGTTSIPITMDNGRTAYANFEPVSMNDIHNSGVDAIYNAAGEKLGADITTMEVDTGMKLSQFITGGDSEASHYCAVPNNTGGLDIRYNADGINSMNIDNSPVIGAVTKDGHNLSTTGYSWGNHGEKSPEADIYDTLTSGSWQNMGFSEINPNDIKFDSDSGKISFSATNNMTGKKSEYTAMPSVQVQNQVTARNTVTDTTHGSYTFSPASKNISTQH